MKKLFLLFILTLGLDAQGNDNHEGPSNLEDEFSTLSNIYLPINYAAINGISTDNILPEHEVDEIEDDLFGDFTGLTNNFSPIAYASWQKVTRLVSLQEGSLDSTNIEAAEDESAYLHIENKKWDLGLGLESSIDLPNPLGIAAARVAFLKGKNYYSIRTLKHKHEKRDALRLPTSQQNLKGWRVGDKILYATRGGVVLNLFLGLRPLLTLGPQYIHSGSYRIKAHLASLNVMEIEVTVTKTDSLGLEALSAPFKLDVSKGKGLLDSVVYQFDLNNSEASKAMAHLFDGRLDLTNQQMLLSSGQIQLSTKIQHSYTSFSGKYGFPLLHVIEGRLGQFESNGKIEKKDSSGIHELEVFSSASSREYFTRGILSHQRWYNETVASTVLRGTEQSGSVISSFYSWSFSKDKMNKKTLRKKLSKLAKVFNTQKLNAIQLPQKRMGYLKADFAINLSGGDILYLLNTANLRVMRENALANFEDDFRLYGHRAFCRLRTYNDCFNRHYLQIKSKYKDLKTTILSLNNSYRNNQINEVTKELTKVLKLLFKSKYLTNSFAQSRPELMFELRLEGENIKRHSIRL
jgi:hypothetical protein